MACRLLLGVAVAVVAADAFAPSAGLSTCRPARLRAVDGAKPRRAAWRAPTSVTMLFDPLISGVSTVASALFFFAYETRPSGDLMVEEHVDVVTKPSSIPGAGLGLFAARDLEAGAVLGTYPGRVWEAAAWLRYKGLTPADMLLGADERASLLQARQRTAEAYTWKLGKALEVDDGEDTQTAPGATCATQTYTASMVIDPTSASGDLYDTVPWIFNTFATLPTLLCRINEPGRGGDVNVVAEEGERSVSFVLERHVKAGEELLMDYGPYYDRTNYGVQKKEGQGASTSGPGTWSYAQLLEAVESGRVRHVTFSADGSRAKAEDVQGVEHTINNMTSDASILDTLTMRKVDVRVLPE